MAAILGRENYNGTSVHFQVHRSNTSNLPPRAVTSQIPNIPEHFLAPSGRPKSEHSRTVSEPPDATTFQPVLFERSGPHIPEIRNPKIFTQHPDLVHYFPPLRRKQDSHNTDMHHGPSIWHQLQMSVVHQKESPNATNPYLHPKCPKISIAKHKHPCSISTIAVSSPGAHGVTHMKLMCTNHYTLKLKEMATYIKYITNHHKNHSQNTQWRPHCSYF